MNEEEIKKIIEMTINKSNKEYISLKNQFEELRNDYIELARSEEQLENNWNELKKHLKEVIGEIENNEYADAYDNCELATTRTIFRKMQELENRKV